jgi:hypothetical protein
MICYPVFQKVEKLALFQTSALHVVGFYYIVFSFYHYKLILEIFTVLNSIEIYQAGSNIDSGARISVYFHDN